MELEANSIKLPTAKEDLSPPPSRQWTGSPILFSFHFSFPILFLVHFCPFTLSADRCWHLKVGSDSQRTSESLFLSYLYCLYQSNVFICFFSVFSLSLFNHLFPFLLFFLSSSFFLLSSLKILPESICFAVRLFFKVFWKKKWKQNLIRRKLD